MLGLGLGIPKRSIYRGAAAPAYDVIGEATTYLGGIAPTQWFDFVNNRAYFGGTNYTDITGVPGWSFTRATTRYGLNAASTLLLPFASGEMGRTDRGLIIENAATNLALWSNDWTNAAWVKSNVTAVMDQTGPDGVASSATKLTASAGNGTVKQSITNVNTDFTWGVWIKRITGSGNIDLTLNNGSSWTTVTVTSSWTLVSMFAASGANPTFGLRIVTSGDAVAVWCGQLEFAAAISSPIPTTTVSVTRNTDVPLISSPGINYPLSIWAEFEAPGSTGSRTIIQLDDGTAANRVVLSVNASNLFSTVETTASATQASINIAGALTAGTTYKIAARFNTNSVQSCRGGTLGTEDTAGTLPATPTTIHFGMQTGATSKLASYLKRVALFNSALIDANLQTVTT